MTVHTPYTRRKRALDAVGASVLILLFAPLLLLVAIAVLLVDGRPVFFFQRRVGLHSAEFVIVKFRTMKPRVGGQKDSDSQRLTNLGAFLRRYSLDELPSLANVLRGDMSFVGPRPLLLEYLDYYSPNHRRRHDVRPGLTGLAQVAGRNRISWEERLDLDVEYVGAKSLLMDAKILLQTVRVVVGANGVVQDNGETMTPLGADYLQRPEGQR